MALPYLDNPRGTWLSGSNPHEAAATLRAFMEKGLPFYRAANEWMRAEVEIVDPQTFYQPPTQNQREEIYLRARAAWFAMKEGK